MQTTKFGCLVESLASITDVQCLLQLYTKDSRSRSIGESRAVMAINAQFSHRHLKKSGQAMICRFEVFGV